MSDDRVLRRQVGAVIVLVGAFLLIAAVLSPWYVFDQKRMGMPTGNFGTTTTYYLGLPSSANTVQYSCSFSGTGPPPSCGAASSYSGASLNNVGGVAEVCAFLIWTGSALGLFAGALAAVLPKKPRWIAPAIALAILATILGFTASGLFAGLLPGAFSKDLGPNGGSSGGPPSSFWGSNSATTPGGVFSATWGPSSGWVLALAGSGFLVVGLLVLFLYRRDPPEPAPVAAPEPMEAPAPASS